MLTLWRHAGSGLAIEGCRDRCWAEAGVLNAEELEGLRAAHCDREMDG